MPTYNVNFQLPAWFAIDVEADSKEEALEKAFEVYEEEVYRKPEISEHLHWDKVYDTANVKLLKDKDSSQSHTVATK